MLHWFLGLAVASSYEVNGSGLVILIFRCYVMLIVYRFLWHMWDFQWVLSFPGSFWSIWISWFYVISHICLPVLSGKNLRHNLETTEPNSFTPAVLIGCSAPLTFTVLYYYKWPWPWLWITTLMKTRTCWLHFFPRISTDGDEIWCSDKQSKLNVLLLLQTEIEEE